MAAAFPGPYVDQSLTTRAPFDQASQAVDVKNPRDLGENRSYRNDLADSPREVDLSAQQADPKPFPLSQNEPVGYDPYANGGGLASYLDNSGS
jgi:hypothetical protein